MTTDPKAEAAGLTVERRGELRRVAEAATPGLWRSAEQTHGEWYGIQSEHFALGTAFHRADAAHIAAFDPPTVLALLDALAAAEAERDEARAAVERVRAVIAVPDDEQEWEVYDCEWHDCEGCEEPHLTRVPIVSTWRIRAALDTATGEGA